MFGYAGRTNASDRFTKNLGQSARRRHAEKRQAAEMKKNKRAESKIRRHGAERDRVAGQVAESKAERGKAREEGIEYARNLFHTEKEGLSPEERRAMQYEANRGIQRNMQSAERKLLGEQSQRGIHGKGGVAYAQQRDLQRQGREAEAGVHRDLDRLNADLAKKKIASMFAVGQGEAAQTQLDKQLAQDEINLEKERNRQRKSEKEFTKLFNRA